MHDSNQVEPGASFAAIYTSRDGSRMRAPSFVIEQHELCEDLAQSLTEQSASWLFKGGSETKTLARVRGALAASDGMKRSQTGSCCASAKYSGRNTV